MTATAERPATRGFVGQPIDRVDGRAKVTGAARYAADAPVDAPLFAVIVQSTVARGRMTEIDERATRAVPGVVEVVTYRNAPRVPAIPFEFVVPVQEELAPLQTDEVHYDGQHVAAVVGATFEAAREGAALLRIAYERSDAEVTIETAHEVDLPEQWFGEDIQPRRGEPETAYAASDVHIDATYVTPAENHNPLEPSVTVAEWRDGELIVHDS
ncbi:MAG TPA: molybdopterin cofactor-binding domain-containing protein, partial [Candidatus Elarobacter sp.]